MFLQRFDPEFSLQVDCCQTILAKGQLHPLVLPHVSHFMHVPLRSSVKFPHSPQLSPS
jgi:hypothetical protein